MALKTERFDVQDFLKTPEEQAGYLDAAFKDGNPVLIATALDDIGCRTEENPPMDIAFMAGMKPSRRGARRGTFEALQDQEYETATAPTEGVRFPKGY